METGELIVAGFFEKVLTYHGNCKFIFLLKKKIKYFILS
jgi:hypothetical protein